MVAEASQGGCIPCHQTTHGQDKRGQAVCRAFFEKHRSYPLQIAERMGLIEFQSVK